MPPLTIARAALFGSAFLALAGDVMAGETELNQKLQALVRLLASPTATQIDRQGNSQAQEKLAKARALRDMTEVSRRQGKIEEAEAQAGEALKLVSEATVMASWRTETPDVRHRRYRDLSESIAAYRDSFDDAAKAKGPAAFQLLDRRRLDTLLGDAARQSGAQRWDEANAALEQALVLVESATIALRNNETVVYSRAFQTPADEYRYESERYAGSLGLLDRRLREGGGAEAAKSQAQTLKNDAEKLHAQALGLAGGGDYEKASRRLEEAQHKLVDALSVLAGF